MDAYAYWSCVARKEFRALKLVLIIWGTRPVATLVRGVVDSTITPRFHALQTASKAIDKSPICKGPPGPLPEHMASPRLLFRKLLCTKSPRNTSHPFLRFAPYQDIPRKLSSALGRNARLPSYLPRYYPRRYVIC